MTDIELLLVAVGAIDPPKPGLTKNPRDNSHNDDNDSDDEKATGLRGKTQDSDDDLDWD